MLSPIVLSPNRWSCVACAFATALTALGVNTNLQMIVDYIGHDGSEDVYPHLPLPLSKRCFHVQELTDYCLSVGVSVTTIFPHPFHTARHPDGRLLSDISFVIDFHQDGQPVTHAARFEKHITEHFGVVTGLMIHNNSSHALAWDKKRLIDPSGKDVGFEAIQIDAFYALSKKNGL